MRPPILNPLFVEARMLKGVGPKVEKLIAKALGTEGRSPRILDLVFHLPFSLVDRRYRPTLIDAEPGCIATVTVNVLDHKPPPRGRRLPYRVLVTDDTAAMEIVFFTAHEDHIRKMLPTGSRRVVSGRVDSYRDRLQMAHPDFIATPDETAGIPDIEPVYRTTDQLPARTLAKAVAQALERLPDLPEWQDAAWREQRGFGPFAESLRTAHAPKSEDDLSLTSKARVRLAYDELLANQLALALVRDNTRRQPGRSLEGDGRMRRKAAGALPFKLTAAQSKAIGEILADMAAPSRMVRLLQGDVGAGKTVVAMMALLNAVEAGCQGAFMAPTEILARQHLAALEPMAKEAGVQLAILTGRERGAARAMTLKALEEGLVDIIVGTHAIFSEDVRFRDLGLAVVDEQHRFGVHQRMQLQGKGNRPADVLVMTATPIPRTLQLTAYGDMDVSRLTGKPPGRQPVETRVLPASRLDEVIAGLKRALAKGARAYWVCPLVEESEKIDLAAAVERAAMLRKTLGDKVGLVHGRLKGPERDEIMGRFKTGEISVLVATTVIEVGVDVPEASIMVVEHAERFGLAQLHQLRGRVGRGTARSTCLLVYQAPLGAIAKQRLEALRATDDGFVIAEEDLRLRGAGELLGTKQSGLPEFHFADFAVHGDLVAAARDDARMVLQSDPTLKTPRGENLRTALYLFGRDEAVRFLRAG
jgi:ATP-dependent DNA helicase RecG